MIRENSDLKIDSDENFIEAAQLMESHRRPVAWLLAIQITLLGLMLIGLVRPSTIPTVAMFVLLAGFLRYANSVWLTAFLTLVIGARIFQTAIGEEFFIESVLLLDSVLILLTLVASFRYIELRNYSRTFELSKSYRRLETSNKPSPIYVLHTMMGTTCSAALVPFITGDIRRVLAIVEHSDNQAMDAKVLAGSNWRSVYLFGLGIVSGLVYLSSTVFDVGLVLPDSQTGRRVHAILGQSGVLVTDGRRGATAK